MRLSNYTLFLFTSSVVVYFRSDRKDKYSFEIMIGAPGTKEQDHEVELVKIGVAFHNRTLTVVVKPVSSQGDPIIAVHKIQEILATDNKFFLSEMIDKLSLCTWWIFSAKKF
jgi:hypothetical protein